MTTLLPTQDLATLRAIARTSAVLLVCLRIDQLHPGRAIADFEIADILEADKRTVQKQLRSLSAAGLVLEQGFRWVVTAQGRNTLFGQTSQPALLENTQNVQDCENEDNHAQNVQDCEDLETGAHEEGEIQAQDMRSCEGKDNHAQNVLLMNDDEEDIKSINDSESSSPIIERANCARILEATSLLFGSAVGTKGITDRDPDVALAWIGKAWNDRKTLRSPQGLIYKRLAENEQPPSGWLEDPCYGLPEEYLRAVGRWQDEPEQVEVVEDSLPAPRRVAEWREVAQAMEGKIRHVAFSGWEECWWEGDVLQVAIRAKRVGDFNRLAAGMAGEVLSGLVGRGVRVEFVAVEEGEG